MAPLPANSTSRLFLDYVTSDLASATEHTLQVRFTGGQGNLSNAFARAFAFINAGGTTFYRSGWRVIRARFSGEGQDFSVPVTLTTELANFVGTGSNTYQPRYEAVEITYQGRSGTTGRRVDVSLYTALGDAALNFRLPAGPTGLAAAVQAQVAALNGSVAAGAFIAVDGSNANWYPYANFNYNSYWERRSRVS